jgi:hypothetical protein
LAATGEWAVIVCHHVKVATAETLPQLLLVPSRPQGRGADELRAVGLGPEQVIVEKKTLRTGLSVHALPGVPGVADGGQRGRCRQVSDVEGSTRDPQSIPYSPGDLSDEPADASDA